MRKILIAALILAGGCDATRRDFKYCSQTYSECDKGFACNLTTGRCEVEGDAGVDAEDAPWTGETQPPTDVPPGEVTLDLPSEKPLGIDGVLVDAPTSDAPRDVPIRVDGDRGDGGESDGPNTCSNKDSECKDPLLPICVNNVCVACRASTDCTNPARPVCSAQNTCVSCALGGPGFCAGKTPTTPVCDSSSGRCVECVDNSVCNKDPAKAFCAGNTCQGCNAPGASASNGGTVDGGAPADGGGIDAGAASACVGAKPMCASTG